ncbi:MAG: metallophosphoesterase, partial [Verrucomicrobiaceae bacterium]
PKKHLDCPFYAVLGNHDYGPQYDSKQGRAKADMQLEYSVRNPRSRFKMPAKWYSVELGGPDNPMVKVIFLDGNTFEGGLTPQEKIEQKRWLDKEIVKPTKAKWLWVASHYPMFSDSEKRGDGKSYIKSWGGYLKDHPVSLYLAGHDHTLQHLRAEGFQTDFVVSGGGGAGRYEIIESGRGFTKATRGFNHLHVTDEKITVRLVDDNGAVIHAFERDRAGAMKVLEV